MTRLLVVAALAPELPRGLDGRRDVVLRAVGVRGGAGVMLDGASAMLVTGSCGALTDVAPSGALVMPAGVVGPGPERTRMPDAALGRRLRDAAAALGIPLHSGTLAEAGQVVDGPVAREQLRAATGADFVDMESATLAAEAESHGIPWAVIRIVTDTPAQPLAWLAELLGGWPESEPAVTSIMAGLARRPWMAPRLLRLATTLRRGRTAVGRVVAQSLDAPLG